MTLFLLIAGYALLSWETAAALFAYFQHDVSFESARLSRREDMGTAWLISLVPPTWLVAPFLTGFYEHGWSWKFERREK